MSRLELNLNRRDLSAVSSLYSAVSRRLTSDSAGACPVDLASAFVKLCHTQSCGKCTPCRVGLYQLAILIDKVLDGEADRNTLSLIEKTADVIMKTADCAIGFEGARVVLDSVRAFRDEYISHIENGRCVSLYESPVPCMAYCPAHVDIPGYIALVSEGRYADAVRLIRKDNPFPSACALICEHPCENFCRRGIMDEAVNIRGLKRMAVDNAGDVSVPERGESTGKRVAVIGGGPSGLTAAYYLSLMGHHVTVYERRMRLGGMLRYGIPSYRLPREKLDKEISAILSTGFTVYTNTEIGKDISFDEIRRNSDAVYIAIGAHKENKPGIEGENGKGVISAVELLRGIGDGVMPDLTGKRVVVIGGGNVAMDCTRSSVRLGAEKVICAYRRRKDDMTALPEEIEGAMEEGCEIMELMSPEKIELDENGNAAAVWLKPQMISKVSRGRPGVIDAQGESVRIPADTVILAIGQKVESGYFEKQGIPASRSGFLANSSCEIKEVNGVFSGGDCVTGAETAIKAIAAGKTAAASIDSYLGFNHEIKTDVDIPEPNVGVYPPCGRVKLSERSSGERKHDFELMENSMTEQQACQESHRCLRCDRFGYGIFRGGRVWKW